MDPVVTTGPIGAARQAQAAELFTRAEDALRSGDAEQALDLATRIVEEFPSASVSGRALFVQAEAALAAGEGAIADAAAERYIGLVDRGDPRAAELRVLQGRALFDEPEEAVDRLARLGPVASGEHVAEAVALARGVVMEVSLEGLEEAAEIAEPGSPVLPVIEARVAALLLRAGEDARAAEVARAALDDGADGPDAALAEAVLVGTLPEGYLTVRRVSLGAVLPLDGAPALSAFSRLLLEGIEVAATTVLGDDFEVELSVQDDAGDPERTAALVAQLERAGASGVVGFLQDLSLEVAAEARQSGVPLMSPTARVASFAGPGVFSLNSMDPVGLDDLARHAASKGYQRIAFIQSSSPLSMEEAAVFRGAVAQFGVETAGTFSFVEGATFFEEQILSARDALRAAEIRALGLAEEDTLRVEMLEPVAVFVPVPAEDVELIAPQIIHFGLDTLGIDVLGTSGWADARALRTIDPRHTNGVVATAPIGAGADTAGYLRFKAAYEEHFQRTLVSPVPAAGYDAALLLLEALRAGGSGSSGIVEALEQLGEVEGATGVFSVVDGRVVRRTHVVLIENATLTPIPIG